MKIAGIEFQKTNVIKGINILLVIKMNIKNESQ